MGKSPICPHNSIKPDCIIFVENVVMKSDAIHFDNIVESIYSLPLEYKEELKSLLEHNISDARRQDIADNYKAAQTEQKSGKLKFSSTIQGLKKML